VYTQEWCVHSSCRPSPVVLRFILSRRLWLLLLQTVLVSTSLLSRGQAALLFQAWSPQLASSQPRRWLVVELLSERLVLEKLV